jgi:hypothetical protein
LGEASRPLGPAVIPSFAAAACALAPSVGRASMKTFTPLRWNVDRCRQAAWIRRPAIDRPSLSQRAVHDRLYPYSHLAVVLPMFNEADNVATLIEQNNKVEELLSHVGYFLWTDGKLGAYVRYVADGKLENLGAYVVM